MEAFSRGPDTEEFALKMLLLGCDIPKGFINSNTALHWAVYNKWLDVSVWLIERGAKVDSRNGMGETPLHLACHTRFTRGIEMLLFHGSDPAVVFTTIPSDSPHVNVIEDNYNVALQMSRPVREIVVDHMIRHRRKTFQLSTVAAMGQLKTEGFNRFLEVVTDIQYPVHAMNTPYVIHSCNLKKNFPKIINWRPESFVLFLNKFPHVIEDVFHECNLAISFKCTAKKNNADDYFANMSTFLQSDLCGKLIDVIISHSFIIGDIILSFNVHPYHEKITELIWMALCKGVVLTSDDIQQIFPRFGYGTFFSHLIRTEIHPLRKLRRIAVLPEFFYDMTMTVDRLYQDFRDYFPSSIYSLLHHFALPKLVEFCQNNVHNSMVQDKIRTLPQIPLLQELARNEVRRHIIDSFRISTSMQFYNTLRRLYIPCIVEKMITLEYPLYA